MAHTGKYEDIPALSIVSLNKQHSKKWLYSSSIAWTYINDKTLIMSQKQRFPIERSHVLELHMIWLYRLGII